MSKTYRGLLQINEQTVNTPDMVAFNTSQDNDKSQNNDMFAAD